MKFVFLCYTVLILLDIILIVDLRWLVYSFLLSKRNLKGAKKIHNIQNKRNKITLAYIKKYTIYPKHYSFFHFLWCAVIMSIVPQYISLLIIYIFSQKNAVIICIVFSIIKLILNCIVRLQYNSGRITKFDKRY